MTENDWLAGIDPENIRLQRSLHPEGEFLIHPDYGYRPSGLEAMSAGVPVITSNRSALPEVAGGAALLVDPDDTEAVGDALRELALNQDLCRELTRRGTARAEEFTWDKAVRESWEVYRKILSGS